MLERYGAICVSYEDLVVGKLRRLSGLFSDIGLSASALAAPAVGGSRADAYGVGSARTVTGHASIPCDEAKAAKAAWLTFGLSSYADDVGWFGGSDCAG